MRELYQTESEMYASTWYFEQGNITGKLATEWFEIVNHLSTFLKKFNDLPKLKNMDALRENMVTAMKQYLRKAEEMRDFMEECEQELREEQAAKAAEQRRMDQLDQLNQRFGMIELDDPQIQYGKLKKRRKQPPQGHDKVNTQRVQQWLGLHQQQYWQQHGQQQQLYGQQQQDVQEGAQHGLPQQQSGLTQVQGGAPDGLLQQQCEQQQLQQQHEKYLPQQQDMCRWQQVPEQQVLQQQQVLLQNVQEQQVPWQQVQEQPVQVQQVYTP